MYRPSLQRIARKALIQSLETRILLSAAPTLVKDINLQSSQSPTPGAAVGSDYYFRGNDGISGAELWKYDGATGVTSLLKDLSPGSASSTISELSGVGDTLFFAASSLWKSDGTAEGTVPLGGSDTKGLTNVNGKLFFWTTENTHGSELWTSDGTAAGTKIVRDIRPGSSGSYSSNGTFRLAVQDTLYFGADDGIHGTELWKSDGTEAGTVLVKDIGPGALSNWGSPNSFVARNGMLVFRCDSDLDGKSELWQSDGTELGTYKLKDVDSFGNTSLGNTIVFSGSDLSSGAGLWSTDGTADGTELIVSFSPSIGLTGIQDLTTAGDLAYFAGTGISGQGYSLWVTDGTSGGTRKVTPEVKLRGSAIGSRFLVLDEKVYFATDGFDSTEYYSEIWTCDGTSSGTYAIKQIRPPGSISINPWMLTASSDAIFFQASDNIAGREFWRSDGTSAGTTRLTDFALSNASNPAYLTRFNGKLFFVADDGMGEVLFATDGTSAGTTTVAVIDTYRIGNPHVKNLCAIGDWLYFSAQAADGVELYRTNGTPTGTVRVADINPGTASSNPTNLVDCNGTLFFTATDGSRGIELWKSDGTVTGTTLVADIKAGSASSTPTSLTCAGNKLYFTVNDGVHGTELWTSDGTTWGTNLVKDITAGSSSSNPKDLFPALGRLFFAATGGLWSTDGTELGTVLVASTAPSSPQELNGEVYYTSGGWLYRTTGGGTGTTLLRTFNSCSSLLALENVVYFAANDGVSGTELWKTDGTSTGTVLVRDITPGSASSTLGNFTSSSSNLYFTNTSGTKDLWTSAGTAANTSKSADLNISAAGLFQLNGVLFYVGDDRVRSLELWKVAVDEVAPIAAEPLLDINTAPIAISISFSEDVKLSLTKQDLVVEDLETHSIHAPDSMSYLTETRTAKFVFSSPLADGNYRAMMTRSQVNDFAGNVLTADVLLDFYVLSADANRDRVVDTQDFNLLAANFGASAKVFSQGNFDYDTLGSVDSTDFNILVAHYGVKLPAPSPVLSAGPFSSGSTLFAPGNSLVGIVDDVIS